eukprot:scaffold121077_cov33-Attheya_sp.AAC.1
MSIPSIVLNDEVTPYGTMCECDYCDDFCEIECSVIHPTRLRCWPPIDILGHQHEWDHSIVERLHENPFDLETATERVTRCKRFVMIAVKHDGLTLKFASEELRNDEEVVLTAFQQNSRALTFATEGLLRRSANVWMQAISMNPSIVSKQYSWYDTLSDRYVIYALEQNPHVYEYLDDSWKDRMDIAQLAVSGCWHLINHVPNCLRYDPSLLIKVVGHKNWWFGDWDDPIEWYDYRYFTEIMKIGALNDPALMECASTELQYDRLFACQIVSKFGSEISKDYFKFRYDPYVILCALRGDGMALQYVNFTVEINLDMAMTAVCNEGMALQYVPEDMRDYGDNGIVRAALLNDGLSLQFVSEEMLNNRDVVMTAVCSNGRALQFASVDLRDDDEVVHLATSNTPCAMKYASERLRGDIGLVTLAFQLMIDNGVLLKEYRDEDFPPSLD